LLYEALPLAFKPPDSALPSLRVQAAVLAMIMPKHEQEF
jgi:hypothetical protein